jgi:hypothetical protein
MLGRSVVRESMNMDPRIHDGTSAKAVEDLYRFEKGGPRHDVAVRVRHMTAHTEAPVSGGKREGSAGTPDASLARMARFALAIGRVTVATMLAAAAGCSTSSPGDGSMETATVADARSGAPIACTSRYDCTPLSSLESTNQEPSVPCCTDNVCRLEPSDYCTDANVQLIQASNYQQSCTVDTDCVAVDEGNFCHPGSTDCPGSAAISKSDYAQYQADVAKTNGASCYAPQPSCPFESGPCCLGGQCQVGLRCPSNAICCGPGGVDCGPCSGDAGAKTSTDGAPNGGPLDAGGE